MKSINSNIKLNNLNSVVDFSMDLKNSELNLNIQNLNDSNFLIQSIHDQLNELILSSAKRRFLYKEISNYLK